MAHTLTIASLNVRSLVKKMDELRHFVHKHNIDVMCVQESWLSNLIGDSIVSITGYTIIRADRPNGSGYGGVAIYVREKLEFTQLAFGSTSDFESVWIRINTSSGVVTLGNIYRPPRSSRNTFISALENVLATLSTYVLVGDFNTDARHMDALNGLLTRNNMRQLVNGPTYVKGSYVSTLDLFMVNLPDTTAVNVTIGEDLGSDHLPVIGVLQLSALSKTRERKSMAVRTKYAKSDSYVRAVADTCKRYESIPLASADQLWTSFVTDFHSVYDTHFPLKEVLFKHRTCVPLTPSLINCIKKRRRLYRIAYLTQATFLWERYNVYKKILDSLLKTHKAGIFKQRLEGATSVAAKWNVLHTVVHAGRVTATPRSSLPSEVHSQTFKDLVQTVVDSTSRNSVSADTYLHYIDAAENASFSWPDVRIADVQMVIGKLKSRASNYESISTDAIKDCSDSIAPVLARLIDACLHEGMYPSCLKTSRVTPIFKGGDSSDPANYRPVSIIPIFGKIFEGVVHAYVSTYFATHNLYASTQHGFIAGRSTVSACADVVDYIHRTVDEQYAVGLVLLDLSKAFDIIDHRILVKKLAFYGFGNTVIKWFASYLKGRVGYVNNNLLAGFTIPGVGVPQGSVLGPLLFNVYVNDLCNAVTKSTLIQYADDTGILVKSRKSAVQFIRKVEFATNEVVEWFRLNKLQVNFKKSCFISFGRNRNLVPGITVDSHILRACDCVKLLGLRIDGNLSYVSHINYVVSRTKQVRVMLTRLAHLFDRYTRQYLVKTLILPVINLYDFIYASASSSCLHRLDVAYNDLMRVILGIRRSVHFRVDDLYKLTSFDRLSDRRQQSLHKFMLDVVEERIQCRLRVYCMKRTSLYSTRSQGYVIPRFASEVGRQRIVVRGLKLLNQQSNGSL